MTDAQPGSSRRSGTTRRDATREKARQIRDQQRKRDKRGRLLLQGGILLGIVAFGVIVTLVIMSSIRPPSPGPRNMASGGVVIGDGLEVVRTPGLRPGAEPSPAPDTDAIEVKAYIDYLCTGCGDFEEANAEQIRAFIEEGVITYEIQPLALLDRLSLGTRYSSRAANAAACVADRSPEAFLEFHQTLFANQPAEQSAGLTDDQLVEIAAGAGVSNAERVEECIREERYRSYLNETTAIATESGVPGTDIAIDSPPVIVVNGEQFLGPWDDPAAFASFIAQAVGQQFNETPSPTPTPED